MKTRYLTLDAMRGVAAIAVFFHHAGGISFPVSMPAGYRAVDLFFVLSGFVLAHAYGDALAERRISPQSFLVIRIFRLYPLYLVGALVGISGALLAVMLGGGELSGETVAIASLTLLLLMPSPTWHESSALMPLNVPAWSLIFELMANYLYSIIVPHLNDKRLYFLIISAGAVMVWSAINNDNANFGSEWGEVVAGVARVTFSFFVGVLTYRFHHRRAHTTPFAWLIVLLVIPLLFVYSEYIFIDLLCIIILFPALIYIGSCIEVNLEWLAKLLGDTSYGLYIIHVPAIMLVYKTFSYLGSNANTYAPFTGLILITFLLITVLALDRVYDRPIRRILAMRNRDRYLNQVK